MSLLGVPLLDGTIIQAGICITLIPHFTPDLDHSSREFGIAGKFFGMEAYRDLVPHRFGTSKRHWTRLRWWDVLLLSHVPGVGTLLRTLLLLMPLLIIFLLFSIDFTWMLFLFLRLWLGMTFSDIIHVAADIITSDFKAMSRNFWRRRRHFGYRKSKAKYY